MSVATPRPSMKALYEFGAGYPDPASFPYDGMAKATARMLEEDGPAAMTYGEPQGYRGLRELICAKYERFEAFKADPENIIVANGSGQELAPLFALDGGGRVIRAGTLSKILGAGVRIGWLCAPRTMIPALQGFLFGGGVNPFMSRVATYFLRDHLDAHIQLLIGVYRAKRDAVLKGLHEVLDGTDGRVNRPEGGFFLWMKLPTGTDQRKLAARAVESRVQYTPGPGFYANGGGEEFIRLAFSYEPPEKGYEGARLLAKAILDAR